MNKYNISFLCCFCRLAAGISDIVTSKAAIKWIKVTRANFWSWFQLCNCYWYCQVTQNVQKHIEFGHYMVLSALFRLWLTLAGGKRGQQVSINRGVIKTLRGMENQEKDHFPSFENHCSLWYSSIDDLPTSDDQWNEFTANLSTADRARVTFFHFADDQKRSYLSLRLQRSLIEQTWHLKDNQYDILRTMEVRANSSSKYAHLSIHGSKNHLLKQNLRSWDSGTIMFLTTGNMLPSYHMINIWWVLFPLHVEMGNE